ncbi:MAG TPA: HepT-like ribonuclease domain-containing protein, partial [Hyphomicrobiales bacterium]|nr:HepT-like ribonuclease domain-containing protein [Hyphomicrobiales bacterium]
VTEMPEEILATDPEIEWRNVKGFRVMAAHQYHRLDPAIVWNVVDEHIPKILACKIGDLPPEDGVD